MRESKLAWHSLGLYAGVLNERRTLIEASAGTGKTWTITMLYLRLLIERGVRATQIVVTTFTDAAADELRERIRERLTWALQWQGTDVALEAEGEVTPDLWLSKRWKADDARRREDHLRLRVALAELDQAPISTIHGLCRRILGDQPFATQSPFRMGELVAEQELLAELEHDLIRHLAHHRESSSIRRLAIAKFLAMPKSERRWRRQVLKWMLSGAVEFDGPDLDGFDQAIAALAEHRASLLELASRTDWRKSGDGGLPGVLTALALASEDDAALNEAIEGFEVIAKAPTSYVLKNFKGEFDRHPGFQAAKAIAETFAQLPDSLALQPLRMNQSLLRDWQRSRFAERNQFSYDELIERAHRVVVESKDVSRLADRLFEQWPVAMIDEFQDTDPRQYALFDAIYREASGEVRGRLLMIGDPKQAIYSFRGGDIDAYLKAAAQATQKLSLSRNFRSSTRMVQALNALYRSVPRPFGEGAQAIAYEEVTAAGEADKHVIDALAPCFGEGLHLRHFDAAQAVADENEAECAMTACVDWVLAALQPNAVRIGEEVLQPKHIAILVPTRAHIARLRDRLSARGVPCVGVGDDSVFDSDWASELAVVLHAVLEAHDAAALRAALATRLFGLTQREMLTLSPDSSAWQGHSALFARLSAGWRQHGVLYVVDRLIDHAAPALLGQPDGERALTDLRHLGELLQTQSRQHSGRRQLLTWLVEQIDGGSDGVAAREHELRIESDEQRLRILTLHASKGLEFDIVLLPLMFKHAVMHASQVPKFGAVTQAGRGRVVDLGSHAYPDQVALVRRQLCDERQRVLYVALTRARHACHVFLPASLLAVQDGDAAASTSPPAVNESGLAHFLHGLDREALVRHGADAVRIAPVEAGTDQNYAGSGTASGARNARPFARVFPFMGMHSFTTLTRRDAVEVEGVGDGHGESADGDAENSDETALHPELSLLKPMRGSQFGDALHAAFEQRELDRPMSAQAALLRQVLAAHGQIHPDAGVDLVSAVAQRMDASLDADLGESMVLRNLSGMAQRAEIGFRIAIPCLPMPTLAEICAAHGYPGLIPARAAHAELRGILSGKIDLIFEHDGRAHVLDYKSNWLGGALADYSGAALQAAMRAHAYDFQALLYVLALDRYLGQRKPGYRRERDLGEVLYLFVRAAGLAPAAGVWRHRFPDALIAALQDAFHEPDGAQL